jgi:hypothetical protein
MLRHALLAGCLCAPALLAGCDDLAGAVGVDAFDVSLGDDAVFPLVPFTALAAPETPVEVPVDLPDVFDVERISIPRSGVTYDPPAGAPGGGEPCDVRLYVMFGQVPALQSTITVADDGEPVRDVSSRYAQPYDREEICAGVEGCPVTGQNLSEAEIREHVDEAVDRGNFNLNLVLANDGACAGLLRIETLHFELDF